ncbi:MAG: hypothetical protein HY822_02930 [Acidobacteria bacterium]|nr:hypothetical protein [Acidobacteriota bacterium]
MTARNSAALLSVLLSARILFPPGAAAQNPAAPPAGSERLKVLVLEGEGSKNSIRSRAATPVLVEVRDANDKPLPGAQVVFQLPASGPGGAFPGGRLMQRANANSQGRAATNGFIPNDQEGRFNIKVTATSGAETASVVVAQANVARTEADAKRSNKPLWILILAGGGTAAALLARGGKSGASSGPAQAPPSITLVPGPVSVGGPR